MVDSNDRDRVMEARDELNKVLSEDEIWSAAERVWSDLESAKVASAYPSPQDRGEGHRKWREQPIPWGWWDDPRWRPQGL